VLSPAPNSEKILSGVREGKIRVRGERKRKKGRGKEEKGRKRRKEEGGHGGRGDRE
jgi:hypothetical protein